MTTRTYKDNFTLDGRLNPAAHGGKGVVTPTKVKAVESMLSKHLNGDRVASAQLMEALTTSDAIFNLAYLANVQFLPNYDEAPRVWRQVAGERVVPDLRPATLFSLARSWTDGNGETQIFTNGAAPTIPEGAAYPYAYISGETSQGAGVTKKGFKTDWTLEAQINDGVGVIDALPSEMLRVSLDTEESDVFGALTTQLTAASDLDGGLVPTGVTVPTNAPLSRDALIRAIYELKNREIGGRKIQVSGGYNVLVPVGQGEFVQFILNQTFAEVQDGSFVLNVSGYNPLAGVTAVETEWLTGNAWMLLPKPGATRRPVVDHLSLRGYTAPQLFVQNLSGNFVGGGAASPFEGSFANDSITLKLRMFGGGVVWDGGLGVVASDGSGV